jgi:hypothetical protein
MEPTMQDRREEEDRLHQAKLAQQEIEEAEIAARSQAAIDAIEDPATKAIVVAVDRMLSIGTGSEDGYIPSIGSIETTRLRKALAAFGVTPDYGARRRIKRWG